MSTLAANRDECETWLGVNAPIFQSLVFSETKRMKTSLLFAKESKFTDP